MFEIRELCDAMNKDKPDIWNKCKNNEIIPESAYELSDLTVKERVAYERVVGEHRQTNKSPTYRVEWGGTTSVKLSSTSMATKKFGKTSYRSI